MDLISSDLISADLVSDLISADRQKIHGERARHKDFGSLVLDFLQKLADASSRFPGGLPKYTSAQRLRLRSRAGLARGFNSGRGSVSAVLSQKYGKFNLRQIS